MLINEIFKSISGESWQAGYPAIFIRTFGCPLRCSYCDSTYAIEGSDYTDMSIPEIMTEVEKLDCRRVILTGGEPLSQKDHMELINTLVKEGHTVEIETSGAVPIDDVVGLDNVYVTMDWKSKSSGMQDKMLGANLYKLRETDALKFVVSTKEDLDDMVHIACVTKAQCFLSPIFGDIEPKEIVEYVLDNNLNDIRCQLQLHKFIWPSDMRGV